ncbi:MAG: T9SS type A sorting domain-containing protein [Saprospiraceae bacterium]
MQRGFLSFFILLMFMFLSFQSNATKFVVKGNGNWSDTNVWDKASIPTSLDTVYIDGYSINIDVKLEIKSIFISNNYDHNSTILNIMDTLTVLGDFNVTAENNPKDIDVLVNGNGMLTVNGNMNFVRALDNINNNRLQFYMYGNSKTYILGDFSFDYKNSSVSETSYDIYTSGNAIFEVRGETTLITRNGKDLDFVLEGNSQVILRDSLSLLLYGGEETAITANENSHFQLLSNAYLLNAGGSNHTKLKSGDIGGKMTISGDVYLESTGNNLETKLEAMGTTAELNIAGDIIMTSTSDASNLIHLRKKGTLNIGGNILRPTFFGALRMESDGKLVFNGSEPQTIPEGKLDNAGSDSLYFGIVAIENTSNSPFQLTNNFIVKDSLILSSGNIITSSSALLIIEDGAFIKGGDSDTYVQGPMMKKGATSGESFTFPIGDKINYAPITITPTSTVSAAEYTAEYYYSDPPPFGVIYLDNVSSSEYWKLTKASGTPDAQITLSWYDAASQGIDNLTDLVVAGVYDDPDPSIDPLWTSYGNGGTTGTTGSNGSGTITSLASDPPPFGVIYFTLGSTTEMNSLPVELTSFQAIQQNSQVHLQWETASERNTSHFSVERSTDGTNFIEIGSVLGSEDGVITHHYTLKDISPENGINYYRLKIVDNDNTFEYSNIEVVIFEETPAIQLFPNPVEKTIQLEGFDSNMDDVQLDIIDRNGKLIFSNKVYLNNGRLQISTDLVNIQNPGTYFLRVISQGQSHVIKLIKIN